MPVYFKNTKIGTIYKGSTKIGQIYKGNTLVYQSAFNITYIVDTNVKYTEKVNPNKSILSPKTFTPKKDGWTFVGWRTNTTVSSTVLKSGDANAIAKKHMTVYAVFKKTITCTFKSYGKTKEVTGTRYYNNGNIINASVTVPTGATRTDWTWRGWSAAGDKTAKASVKYKNGATISDLTANKTYYGLYYQAYSQTTSWNCGWCGTNVVSTSKPSSCPNNVCGSGTSGQKWYSATSVNKTRYYSASGNTKEE